MSRSSSHCRYDADFISGGERRGNAFTIPDVLSVDEYVDEPANLTGVVSQSITDSGKTDVEGIENLPDVVTDDRHTRFTVRESAERSGNQHNHAWFS
jgi:hypothetical protein